MASSTTNLDLILPVGGENVSRQIINANNVKIDEAVGDVPSGTNLQSQVTALNNNIASCAYFGAVQNETISLNQTSGFYVADFSDLTAPAVSGRTFVGYFGFIETYRAAVLGFGGNRCYYHLSAPTNADATVKVYPMYL